MGWKPPFSLCSLALGAGAACHESSSEPTGSTATAQQICDPLASPRPPLATIIVAGRAADGTIFVIDTADDHPFGPFRLFRGTEVLERLKVDGSGSSPDFIGLDAAGLHIRVDLQNNKGTALFVSPTPPPEGEKIIASGTGETLTLLQESDVRGHAVNNPLAFTVLADATTPDRHRLFVFQNEVKPREKRVFYGEGDRLLERTVLADAPMLDDATQVTFDLDGVSMRAHLASYSNDPRGPTSLGRADGTGGAPIVLVPIAGSPGTRYGGLGVVVDDAGMIVGPSTPEPKTAAELTAGFTFTCF